MIRLDAARHTGWMIPSAPAITAGHTGVVSAATDVQGAITATVAAGSAGSLDAAALWAWPLRDILGRAIDADADLALSGWLGMEVEALTDDTAIRVMVGLVDGTALATATGAFLGIEATSATARGLVGQSIAAGTPSAAEVDALPATLAIAGVTATYLPLFSLTDGGPQRTFRLSGEALDAAGDTLSAVATNQNANIDMTGPLHLACAIYRAGTAGGSVSVRVGSYIVAGPQTGRVLP